MAQNGGGGGGIVDGIGQGRTLDEHYNTLQSSSWASVAAIPTKKNNKLVVHTPSDGIKRTITESNRDEAIYVNPSEARVVWVRPRDIATRIDTKIVTKAITQGPLFSVAYSAEDHAVCLIFRSPDHAFEFLELNAHQIHTTGYGILGSRYDVLPGQGYPNNEEIRRMDPPRNERRRLTFARSQLFCNGLSEVKFKRDIYSMVGEDHVELVWLFNTGNGKRCIAA